MFVSGGILLRGLKPAGTIRGFLKFTTNFMIFRWNIVSARLLLNTTIFLVKFFCKINTSENYIIHFMSFPVVFDYFLVFVT